MTNKKHIARYALISTNGLFMFVIYDVQILQFSQLHSPQFTFLIPMKDDMVVKIWAKI